MTLWDVFAYIGIATVIAAGLALIAYGVLYMIAYGMGYRG